MKDSSVFCFLIAFSLFTAVSGLHAQPCPQGNLDFNNQPQLDSFKLLFPNCKEIQGSVRIHSYLDTISNLLALSEIRTIGGYLSIYQNPGLKDFSGLENLTTINEYLAIGNNAQLQNLVALNNMEEIGHMLDINNNPRLEELSGLDNIKLEVMDKVFITDNILLNICSISSVCQHLQHYGRFEIHGNGPDCEFMENVYQHCLFSPDTLEQYEENCFEDGFENWQDSGDTLMPEDWSVFPAFWLTDSVPNIERRDSINEGIYALLLRSNRNGFEGPTAQTIWRPLCGYPPQVDITFTYTCKGLGFCEMILGESDDTLGGYYARSIWTGQSIDTIKRTVVLNNIPVRHSGLGFNRIIFKTHPMYETNGTWGGTEFTLDSLVVRSQHKLVSALTEPKSQFEPVVFPNPSTGLIFILPKADELPIKVNLFDSSGRMVATEVFNTYVDLSEYPPGIYLIKLDFEKYTTIHKIVKL